MNAYFRRLVAGIVLGFVFTSTSSQAQTLAEALDSGLTWTTGGSSPWFGQTTNTHDGADAVRSGVIGPNQSGWMETTVTGPATVRFWSKWVFGASPFSWSFTVNGGPAGQGMGTSWWTEQVYDLGAGANALRWSVSDYHGTGNSGFVILDEFHVSSPRPLAFAYEPYDQTVYAGGSVYLWASAVGTPPFWFQWRKEGADIPNATNAVYALQTAATTDSGAYSVVVTNSQGAIGSSNATVTVLAPAAPFFTSEPASLTAYSGETVMLYASVEGSPPFTFLWRKDGLPAPGTVPVISQWGSHSLTLTNVSAAETGSYTVLVTNVVGSIESSNAVVTVVPSVAPTITRQPRSLEVAAGVNTWMSVAATGTPDPGFRWQKIGDEPPPGPPLPISSNPALTFPNVGPASAGVYFATATNPGGQAVSREALLTVLPPLTSRGSSWPGAEDIFITNGLAFLAQGASGLGVLSVSNPAAPSVLGTLDTAGYASGVCVAGGLAYVADGSGGLQVISVTNPTAPLLVGGYSTPRYASQVVERSNLVYIASDTAGLLILSVSNPAAPSFQGSYAANIRARSVCLEGKYALVSSPAPDVLPGTNVAGTLVIDVSDPAHPAEVGRIGTGFWSMDTRDSLLFGATGSGLQILSLTNPAQPQVVGSFNSYYSTNQPPWFRISAYGVRVQDHLVYLSGSSEGVSQLFVLDVRDSAEPIPVGYFTAPGQASAIEVDGRYAFISGFEDGFLAIETPFDPEPVKAPSLVLTRENGLHLQINGQRGLHYDVEYADLLPGLPWQRLQSVLLTNDTQVFGVSSPSSQRYFRVRGGD